METRVNLWAFVNLPQKLTSRYHFLQRFHLEWMRDANEQIRGWSCKGTKTLLEACIPETIPIICHQVRPAPYKEQRELSMCFPNTAQLIRYSFMDNYCAASGLRALRKNEPTNLPSAAPSLHPIPFHAYISQTLLCNKAKIKRIYAQVQWRFGRALCLWVGGIQKNLISRNFDSRKWAGLPSVALLCGFVCRRCWML